VDARGFMVGERILLTLWVGGLWTVGYVVAPVLFAKLDDHALAGTLAGILFHIIAWIGLLAGTLLLAGNQMRNPGRRANWRAGALLLMLLLVAVGQFVLAPLIADMRAGGLTDGSAFAMAHGIASLGYLATSLLGLALVAAGPGDAQP